MDGIQDSGRIDQIVKQESPMLYKLIKHYQWVLEMGNGGHAVKYKLEDGENIRSRYKFGKGVFSLRGLDKGFATWDYDVIKDWRL